MPKPKLPFKRHPLRPIKRPPFTPPLDKLEGLTIAQRGYFPGSNYSDLEKAFLREIELWQKRNKSKFLGHVAYLRILLMMGFSPPPGLVQTLPQREDDL